MLRSTAREWPAIARSVWNWAKDSSSSSRADCRPIRSTRFTAMFGDGRKDDFSGKVRVEARPATWVGSTRGPESTTAWPSTSIPRRPALPVSCVYSAGVRSAWFSPLNLTSFSMTVVRAGMLTPSARVSVANTHWMRPAAKSSSTISRKSGSMPAWWAA